MTFDILHVIGWLVVAWLLYSAIGTYIDLRKLKAYVAGDGRVENDPVMARFDSDAGRSQWIAIGLELAVGAVVVWLLLR